jgi:hypothetical protein
MATLTGFVFPSVSLRLCGKYRATVTACVAAILMLGGFQPDSLLSAEPLSLHPDNGHYFLFRGKPTILITSGEHYGAVLNADFDIRKYMEELAVPTLNNTRVFSGAYVEPAGAFNIARNTLAPDGKRFVCPWARSDEPGYAGGGNKFDLSKWDESYFYRLRICVKEASKRNIVVEMNLFCPMYDDAQWKVSPMNAANNVNGIGTCGKHEVYTLDKDKALLEVQEKMTRKIVQELNEFDNLYYEVCNEPYFGGVTMDWQHRIVDVIHDTEKSLPNKHLVSMNVANGSKKIENPHPGVSIFNFHYASPPTAVAENFALNKVIGDNETGFKGTADDHYRMEAWEFLLAGGGLYNNLDYSFAVGEEDGRFEYPPSQPGGGSRNLRLQLKFLKNFLYGFDFIRMKPDPSILKSKLPDKTRFQALAQPGKQYAIYLHGELPTELKLSLAEGSYRVETFDVVSGKRLSAGEIGTAGKDPVTLKELPKIRELAIRIVASPN